MRRAGKESQDTCLASGCPRRHLVRGRSHSPTTTYPGLPRNLGSGGTSSRTNNSNQQTAWPHWQKCPLSRVVQVGIHREGQITGNLSGNHGVRNGPWTLPWPPRHQGPTAFVSWLELWSL